MVEPLAIKFATPPSLQEGPTILYIYKEEGELVHVGKISMVIANGKWVLFWLRSLPGDSRRHLGGATCNQIRITGAPPGISHRYYP